MYISWEDAGNPRNWRKEILGAEEAERIAQAVRSPLLVGSCEEVKGIIAFYESFIQGDAQRARTPEEISPLLLALGLATESNLKDVVEIVTNCHSYVFDMGIVPAMRYLREPWQREVALTNDIPGIRSLLTFQLHPHIHISTGRWQAEISAYCQGD